jgi:ATP-binding cassette subfamily C protein
MELLDIFLSKKTSSFYKIKKSQILKYILSDVERVLIGTQFAVVELISDAMVCIFVVVTLLYIDVWVTLITAGSLVFLYIMIFVLLARKINTYGKNFSELESRVYSSVNQIIDLFREIRVAGKKEYFLEEFSAPSNSLVSHAVNYSVLSFLPVQLVEIAVFGVLIVMATYFSVSDTHSVHAVASITLFAFAAYRLVPLLKSIFDVVEDILYNSPVLEELLIQYHNKETDQTLINGDKIDWSERLLFKREFGLRKVTFSYSSEMPLVLKDFTIRIPIGKFSCLSGESGSGKSTILDIMLGLLRPAAGGLYVDDLRVKNDNIRQWQNNIGYVPQKIQFVDGTIYQNIAFGISPDRIDRDRVRAVAKLVAIDRVIEHQLPEQYNTLLGDGGTALSGGEKQRIGIARSLYHDPQVLIFDEATNELDAETESRVLDSIKALKNVTVLFVSHKQAVMDRADHHVVIEKYPSNQSYES